MSAGSRRSSPIGLADGRSQARLRDRGVYVITGGLGGSASLCAAILPCRPRQARARLSLRAPASRGVRSGSRLTRGTTPRTAGSARSGPRGRRGRRPGPVSGRGRPRAVEDALAARRGPFRRGTRRHPLGGRRGGRRHRHQDPRGSRARPRSEGPRHAASSRRPSRTVIPTSYCCARRLPRCWAAPGRSTTARPTRSRTPTRGHRASTPGPLRRVRRLGHVARGGNGRHDRAGAALAAPVARSGGGGDRLGGGERGLRPRSRPPLAHLLVSRSTSTPNCRRTPRRRPRPPEKRRGSARGGVAGRHRRPDTAPPSSRPRTKSSR